MSRTKIGTMPLNEMQVYLIGLFEQHGSAAAVQKELGISQSRLSELIKTCGLRRVTRVEAVYTLTPKAMERHQLPPTVRQVVEAEETARELQIQPEGGER